MALPSRRPTISPRSAAHDDRPERLLSPRLLLDRQARWPLPCDHRALTRPGVQIRARRGYLAASSAAPPAPLESSGAAAGAAEAQAVSGALALARRPHAGDTAASARGGRSCVGKLTHDHCDHRDRAYHRCRLGHGRRGRCLAYRCFRCDGGLEPPVHTACVAQRAVGRRTTCAATRRLRIARARKGCLARLDGHRLAPGHRARHR